MSAPSRPHYHHQLVRMPYLVLPAGSLDIERVLPRISVVLAEWCLRLFDIGIGGFGGEGGCRSVEFRIAIWNGLTISDTCSCTPSGLV